jgi:hypothetical protein
VEVQFAAEVATTLNCVVYAVFEKMLEINREKSASIIDGYLSTEMRFDSGFRPLVRWSVSQRLVT